VTARAAADPTCRDLAAHLRRDEPLPVYALVGTEAFARSQAVQALRQAVLRDADPDLALSHYLGSDVTDPAALLDELRTPPFLAPRRLVVVDDAAPLLAKAADPLLRYLAKPSRTGTLVLTVDKLPRNSKLGKAVRKVGMAVACTTPRERELPGWIAARARAHRKRIDTPAARRLAECVGVNLPILDQSLAKLALYVGPRDTITEPDVDALVEELPVTTIFKLTDAVGLQQPAKALRVLDHLLAQNHDPSYILSMVRWAMERLLNTRTLLDAGQGPEAIARALKMRSTYFVDQTIGQARRRSRDELRRGFALILKADLHTKTSTMDPRDVLEHLLLQLCAPSTRQFGLTAGATRR